MANFFAELKRRHIYRVAAAYAVVAWVLLQIVNNIIPLMQAPVWTGQFCLLLLALGFPIAVFFAWMRELPASDTAAPVRTSVMDGALIGVLVIVIALISYQQFAAAPSRSSSLEAAREASVKPAGISIAVLPFANMSGDASQEFFSDGMTEEITSALAKVPDLRVVGRTSSFQFKGQNQDLRSIGQSLSATHLIEGSVRKAGDRVRITVQLIKSDDGTHIWAEDYDRQLTDIFQIQEDIARAITASLNMQLGLKPGENLVSNRSIDPESYQQYLRAKELERIRGLANLNTAVALLDEVVARNPGYAPAWALLALTHNNVPNYSGLIVNGTGAAEDLRALVESSRKQSESAAKKAIQLNPDVPDGYVALALTQGRAGKFLEAEDLFSKSLRLGPNQPDALFNYSQLLAYVGHVKKALAVKEQLRALESFVPIYNRDLGMILSLTGQNDAALAVLNRSNELAIGGNVVIAIVHAAAGRFGESAQTLSSAPSGTYSPDSLEEAVRILRIAAAGTAASPSTLPMGLLNFVHLFTTAPERVFESYERNVEAGWMANAQVVLLWHPSYAPVRKTEQFKALARKIGLVDYWRAKGWPEFCHPTTGDDFECN